MWLHVPLLLLGITCTASGLKFPLPLRQRDGATPLSKPAGRGKLPPRKRPVSGGAPSESQKSSKASKRGFVRPTVSKVGSVPERDNAYKFLAETGDRAKSILSGTSEVVTEVVVRTLVNTGPVNALLTPLHKWSSSRKRVAEAVKAAAAAGEPRPATAAERERRKQQRALFEAQEEIRTNPWLELLRDTVPLPQPVENTYNALVSVAAVPGQLVQTGKQTAETLKVAAETVAAIPDCASETVGRTQATVKTAQEVLAGAPGRVQDVVTATRELPGRVERAVEEGTEAVEVVAEAGRKAAEAVETLPSRLPDLMETVADDALSLAEGAATGVDAAGEALWGLTKDVAVWASDLVLRQALAPFHEYRTSARRVQAALDEEQAALPQARPPPRSSAEKEAPSSPALLVTAGATPPGAGDSSASEEDTTPDIGDSMPVSRLAGLRGRFSSWRRKRKSIPAVAVADEDDVDSRDSNTASSSSKPMVSQSTRAASSPAQAESRIAARRSGTLADEVGVGATAKTPTAENVLVTDGQVAAAEVLSPLAGSVSGGGVEASSKEKVSRAPIGALAVFVASEDGGAAKGAAVPAVARTLRGAGSGNERKETSWESEKGPVATVTRVDPSKLHLDQSASALAGDDEPRAGEIAVADEQGQSQTASSLAGSLSVSGASSGTGGREQADDQQAFRTSVGGGAGDDASKDKNAVAAMAQPKGGASAVTPRVDTDSNGKDALLGGPDADTPLKKERPSSTRKPGESATAVAAVNNAKEPVKTPAVSAAAGSTARKQVAAKAAVPSERGECSAGSLAFSASLSSPAPTGTALSRPSPSRNEAATKRLETPTKIEDRGRPADEAGSTLSLGKPAVVPPKSAKDKMAAAPEEAVPRAAGKSGGIGGGGGAVDGPSSAWNAMNPAAEFLKDWVDKAVPQKKAELKRRERAVCWERQWYPVAKVSELLQQQHQRRFQMLDREYELAPVSRGGQGTSRGWECQAVADPSDEVGPAAAASRVPLRESNGLLLAWPDTSPEGLAAAELASPASLPEFLGAGGMERTPGMWRRLLRRQATPHRVPGNDSENGTGGQEADHEDRGNQRYVLCVEQEISCGFSDAVRSLLAASHGQAVREVAAGGSEDSNGPEDEDLSVASSLAGGTESSSAILRAAFDTSSAQGEVVLSSPTVVEWRFSPVPRPGVDGTPASVAQEEPAAATAAATVTQHDAGVTAVASRRRSWLRRRLSGLGGGGRGGNGDVDVSSRVSRSAAGSDHRDRRPAEGGVRQGGAAHYVVSLLPVGPNRTKVFARLELEPSGLLGGRSLWWSRRIRRALLVAALDEVASGQSEATGGNRSPLLSWAAEAWLEGAADGGPF